MSGYFVKTPKGHIVHIRGRKLSSDEQKRLLGEIMDKAYEDAVAVTADEAASNQVEVSRLLRGKVFSATDDHL